jgi:hypothetical protein
MSAQLTTENRRRMARTDFATGPELSRRSRTLALRVSVGTLAPCFAFHA